VVIFLGFCIESNERHCCPTAVAVLSVKIVVWQHVPWLGVFISFETKVCIYFVVVNAWHANQYLML
jgi:hypothetical protein